MCMVLPYDNFFRWAARVVQGVGERRSAILPSANARSDEEATVLCCVLANFGVWRRQPGSTPRAFSCYAVGEEGIRRTISRWREQHCNLP